MPPKPSTTTLQPKNRKGSGESQRIVNRQSARFGQIWTYLSVLYGLIFYLEYRAMGTFKNANFLKKIIATFYFIK
jgi:hypothetical protein